MLTLKDQETTIERIKELFENLAISTKPKSEDIKEIFTTIQLSSITKDSSFKKDLIDRAQKSISGILKKHKKLQPFAKEFVEIFENLTQQKEQNLFQGITKQYSSQDAGKKSLEVRIDREIELTNNNLELNLSAIIKDISKIADDQNLEKKLGALHAKEFRNKISSMAKDFNEEKHTEIKAEKLSENLKSISDWSENCNKNLNTHIFRKIASALSSCILSLSSLIKKDYDQFKKHRYQASQVISEIINNESMAAGQKNIATEVMEKTSFANKLTQNRNADIRRTTSR